MKRGRKKTDRFPTKCRCSRLHVWTDCTLFGKKGAWDTYYTVVIDNEDDVEHRDECLHEGELWEHRGVGNLTSNEGEYSGVIAALQWAKDTGQRVHIITDSFNILGHIKREFACTQHLRPYRDKVLRLIEETDAWVEWLPREHNKAGWWNDQQLKEKAKARTARRVEGKQERAGRAIERMARKLVRPATTKDQQRREHRLALQARYDDD